MADPNLTASDATIEADFEKLLANHAPDVQATARALRQQVTAVLPAPVEQIDFGNRLLAIGRSRAMRDLLFAIIPHTSHVNLQLADGANLPNLDGAIEGTGKRIRHVKVRSAEGATSAAVQSTISAQVSHVR